MLPKEELLLQHELDIPKKVIIGPDTRHGTAKEAEALEWSRVLIVSDPFGESSGHVGEIEDLLSKADIDVSVHTDVTGEPDTVMVEKALERFRAMNCDGIIAIGGGSVIDTAKTVSVLANNEGTVQSVMGVDNVARKGAGIIVLPTTSGTGSEATKVVVIGDSQTRVKMTGRSRFYVPDVAILDYRLTLTMPKPLTAAVGVDALTHAIEAYVSRRANDSTDEFSLSAARLIWDAVRKAWHDGADEDARRDMLIGSFRAGIAFSNASVGLVHSMSEPIGACFHVPHGLSNAMLLPACTEFSIRGAPARYAAIARCMGLADDSADDDECSRLLVEQLHRLNSELKIPSPKAFGIDKASYESQIDKMADDAAEAGSTANNPLIPTLDDIKDIYRNIYR